MGRGKMYHTFTYRSPVGQILLAGEGNFLTGLWFEGQKYYGANLKGQEVLEIKNPVSALKEAVNWLDRYFAGLRPDISELFLKPAGTNFQKEVWEILCGIPCGKTMTYGEIARRISGDIFQQAGLCAQGDSKGVRGCGMSPQAVGGAVGRNPISIIIPCHRVLGADGSLTGYAGGVDRKRWLLKHEGALN